MTPDVSKLVELFRKHRRGPIGSAYLRKAADALEAQQAEIERLRSQLSRCLLGDPPGDCYAAECVDLRAEIERLRYAIKVERGKTEKADEDNERLRGLLQRWREQWGDGCQPDGDLIDETDAALGTQEGER